MNQCLLDYKNFVCNSVLGKATKSARRMPWYEQPKKDAISGETLRGVANKP